MFPHSDFFQEAKVRGGAQMLLPENELNWLLQRASDIQQKRPGTKVLEIGTFVGRTACYLAAHGLSVVTLEKDADVANWVIAKAKENKWPVEVIAGSAGETLKAWSTIEPYSFIFIDADKSGYPEYFSLLLDRAPKGYRGIWVFDNVFLSGSIKKEVKELANQLETLSQSDKSPSSEDLYRQTLSTDTRWSEGIKKGMLDLIEKSQRRFPSRLIETSDGMWELRVEL